MTTASPPSEPAPPPLSSPLTAEQLAEAEKVYRHILSLRARGARAAVLILDKDVIGFRAAGDRIDVALALKTAYNSQVTS